MEGGRKEGREGKESEERKEKKNSSSSVTYSLVNSKIQFLKQQLLTYAIIIPLVEGIRIRSSF
jgi:hypothetical protein